MEEEILTVKELAQYLRMNERTVYKLAQEGKVPVARVGNQWRFKKSLVNEWLELEMRKLSSQELMKLEEEEKPLKISSLIRKETVSLDLLSQTKGEVLEELAGLLVKSGHVKTGDVLLHHLKEREELHTTGIEEGVAFPHPRRCLADQIKEPVVALGISKRGIDFASLDGKPTFLFFLLSSPDDRTHLRVLAKLSRFLREKTMREKLKKAKSPGEAIQIIGEEERRKVNAINSNAQERRLS